MKILDISQYNTITDFSKIKKEVDGIILRLGYRGYGSGKIARDKKFDEYVKECERLKIPWGMYFVTQAMDCAEASEEANYCVANIKKDYKYFSLGVWCDNEYCSPNHDRRADKISKAIRTKIVNHFSFYLTSLNVKNGLYCSDSWLDSHLNKNELIIPIYWIARYGKNDGEIHKTKPINNFDYWQYTSNGKINGVKGNCDLSIKRIDTVIPSIKGYKGFSIVQALNQFGYPSDFAYRKTIAEQVGIKNYKGTSKQNLSLINILKSK